MRDLSTDLYKPSKQTTNKQTNKQTTTVQRGGGKWFLVVGDLAIEVFIAEIRKWYGITLPTFTSTVQTLLLEHHHSLLVGIRNGTLNLCKYTGTTAMQQHRFGFTLCSTWHKVEAQKQPRKDFVIKPQAQQ